MPKLTLTIIIRRSGIRSTTATAVVGSDCISPPIDPIEETAHHLEEIGHGQHNAEDGDDDLERILVSSYRQ
jgi:hypothetical protein